MCIQYKAGWDKIDDDSLVSIYEVHDSSDYNYYNKTKIIIMK